MKCSLFLALFLASAVCVFGNEGPAEAPNPQCLQLDTETAGPLGALDPVAIHEPVNGGSLDCQGKCEYKKVSPVGGPAYRRDECNPSCSCNPAKYVGYRLIHTCTKAPIPNPHGGIEAPPAQDR